MASEEESHYLDARPTTLTLALRPRASNEDIMTSAAVGAASPSLVASPGISVEFHGDPEAAQAQTYPQYVWLSILPSRVSVNSVRCKLRAARCAELSQPHEASPKNSLGSSRDQSA
jgi:hypothetical protein